MATTLRGITWNHLRGYGPLEASIEKYHEIQNQVNITWHRRTLQEFADFSVCRLAREYDLIVMDHPSLGEAIASKCLEPLDTLIPKEFLDMRAKKSVGKSNSSYIHGDHQWAISIDAAAQVSAYREDLLFKYHTQVPRDWISVYKTAKDLKANNESCYVSLPLVPIDAFSCFVSLCVNRGVSPFVTDVESLHNETIVAVLDYLKRLVDVIHPNSLKMNPIDLLDLMSESDEIIYVPLLFGYSNYSREGFRLHPIKFGNIPSSGKGPVGALLGGAGLAISTWCRDQVAASEYAMWLSRSDIQQTFYFEHGGQPGDRDAWMDKVLNQKTNNFFQDTLETLEHAYLRPRYNGFLSVQDEWGKIIHHFLEVQGDSGDTCQKLKEIYFLSHPSSD